MNTPKTTNDNWRYDEPSNWLGTAFRICNENFDPIATVQISGWPKRQARRHAAMIAAAPKTLAACRKILDVIEDCDEIEIVGGLLRDLQATLAEAIREATP